MNDLVKWLEVRKNLYKKAHQEVLYRLGVDSAGFRAYEAQYRKEFQDWQIASKEELFTAIKGAQLLLLADFHALHQSQRAQLRILRNLPERQNIYLAVEFLFEEDQTIIDAYMLDQISEREFLEKTRWQERWGFPFHNYKVLLDWAKKRNIIVRGLNKYLTSTSASTLTIRDEFAADIISDLVLSDPDSLTVVIYGDLHLASAHIPDCLSQRLGTSIFEKTVRVFQNSEEIYFDIAQQGLELKTDLVSLDARSFCLLNIPPWVKWQSYLMFLDNTSGPAIAISEKIDFDDDSEEDEDGYEGGEADVADQVSDFVKILASDLDRPCDLDRLSVYSSQSENFFELLVDFYDESSVRWIEQLIQQDVSFYLPEAQCGYLARLSVNHGASLAAHYFGYGGGVYGKLLIPEKKTFLQMILQESLIYFGSKLINPKRKTPTLQDLQLALLAQNQIDVVHSAMKIALAQKLSEMMSLRGVRVPAVESQELSLEGQNHLIYFLAARFLGGMLGEKLHWGYRHQEISNAEVLDWLTRVFQASSLSSDEYFKIVEVIDKVILPFVSKEEVL